MARGRRRGENGGGWLLERTRAVAGHARRLDEGIDGTDEGCRMDLTT